MDLGLRGKVALVTGASSGIGEAVALALASEGAKLAVAARRRERLEDVAERARRAGAPDARAYVADQTDPDSLARAVREVEAQLGPVEILVVNGGGPRPGPHTPMSDPGRGARDALTTHKALRPVRGGRIPPCARGAG